MGKIMAVNISEKKGTQKKNVHSARLMEEFGIEKDAHAGKWHRQVSLLSYEKIEEFKAKGAPIEDGAFGENLIVSGYDLKALPVGTRLRSGEVLLEVTQIGKKCHSGCEIYKIMGDCIMPREGIFTRVLHGGVLTEGEEIVIEKARQMENKLNHFDQKGNAVMVDVSGKIPTSRTAVAKGKICVCQAVMDAVKQGNVKIGDVLGVARVAGIMAVKQTSHLIPMCHPLMIQKCSVDFELDEENLEITAICTAKTEGQTGVEMEALTGVNVALLTIYDMCKAIDKSMELTDIHLVEKSGGKSGLYRNPKE